MVFEHDLHHRICDGAASHKPRQSRVTTAAGAAEPRQFHVARITASLDLSGHISKHMMKTPWPFHISRTKHSAASGHS